jgi:Ca2+-dependent lipid-binding protein
VEVVKAENILALAKTTSDPYLTIALADIGGREIKTESFKTKQKANTLAPQWNEKFVFGNYITLNLISLFMVVFSGAKYDLDTTDELPTLSLAMFHKGAYSVSEVPMGVITVHLDSVDQTGGTTEQAYELETTGRMKVVSGAVNYSDILIH